MKSLRSKFDLRIIRRGSMVWSIARLSRLWIVLVALCVLEAPLAAQRATLRPADPIASIDGEPILLGELNYLLTSQLRVKDLSEVRPEVKQAASALLVRRHLAMKSLREQGGAALTATLDRQWEAFLEQLRRNGIDLEQYCKQKESNERSVRQSNDWDSAW